MGRPYLVGFCALLYLIVDFVSKIQKSLKIEFTKTQVSHAKTLLCYFYHQNILLIIQECPDGLIARFTVKP